MRLFTFTRSALALLAAAGLGACADDGATEPVETPFDNLLVEAGKADQVQNAHILDDIDLDSVIDGKFDPRVRV